MDDILENITNDADGIDPRYDKNAVDHPKHYNAIDGIECIDVVEQMNFNLGNAVKYIWRSPHTDKSVEDLQKAIWYLNREIWRITKGE